MRAGRQHEDQRDAAGSAMQLGIGRRATLPSAHSEGLRGILATWLTTPHGTGPSTTR